jgi:outer membrane protein OmpA-like peptidoglycan-associated protein
MSARSLYRYSKHAGLGALVLCLCAGCAATATSPPAPELAAKKVTVKQTTSTTTVTAAPIVVQAAPPPAPEPEPQPDSITASASLRQLCGISDEGTAHFDVNSANLKSTDNDLLSKIAGCVKDGKLGDHKLSILGFTDPRGSEDYNLKLGRERAGAAKKRLISLGVTGDTVMVESRGESEAKGTDETSWAFDRRVELHLDDETGVYSGAGSAPR